MGHSASILDEAPLAGRPDCDSPGSSSNITSGVATGFTDKFQFELGDYLQCMLADGTCVEGLCVERSSQDCITLFSDGEYNICLASNCTVLSKADEFEVGDHVQARPVGELVHYLGRISSIHQRDGVLLYDVEMDGDPEDKECNIPASSIIKIMSRRAVALHRWRKGVNAINAIHNMKSKTDSWKSMGSKADSSNTEGLAVEAPFDLLYAATEPRPSQ